MNVRTGLSGWMWESHPLVSHMGRHCWPGWSAVQDSQAKPGVSSLLQNPSMAYWEAPARCPCTPAEVLAVLPGKNTIDQEKKKILLKSLQSQR